MHPNIRTLPAWLVVLLFPVPLSAAPAFEPAECPFEVPEGTEGLTCGYLEVPEDRSDPDGRTLRLAVAVLESFSDNPQPDPVVFLAGGPGGPSIEFMPARLNSRFWNRYREDRDLVFYDQRGAGFSEPAFCPETDVVLYTMAFRGLSPEDQRQRQLAAIEACRDQLLAEGVDFAHYNSVTSARDLADLRRALGLEEWNLFGVSYGTRLALVTLREDPEGIRSVVLDAAFPPDAPAADDHARFARSLQLVFDRCAAEPECQAAFPQLERDFFATLADLEASPIEIAMADTSRFPAGRIVVDGSVMAAGVFQGFYNGKFAEVFPLLVREVRARNVDVLRAIADGLVQGPPMRYGLFYAIQCAESFGLATPDEMAADLAAHPELRVWTEPVDYLELCTALHGERADDTLAEPVDSDVPTLLVSGDYDPITPPSYAEAAMVSLPNASLVVVPGEGHGAIPNHECTRDLVARFLADPDKTLDTQCVERIPEPRFVTDVHMTPGVSRLMAQTSGAGLSGSILGVGAMALLLASALVVWPLAWLWRRLRSQGVRHSSPAKQARWLAALVALLVFGFFGALAAAVSDTLQDNAFVLAFGLPTNYGPLFILPWLALFAAAGTLVYAVAGWRSRWWGAAGRIHYTLVALAGFGCVAWLGSLGFF